MNKFHNLWHNIIRRETGASFVGFETLDNRLSLKVIKDKIHNYVDLNVPFHKVDGVLYKNILKDLKSNGL